MSGRAGDAAQGGGGRGGRGGGRAGRHNKVKKTKHVLKTEDIKHDVFECGAALSAAQFEKSNKAVIEHICRDGSKELILIAEAIETGVVPFPFLQDHRRSRIHRTLERLWMTKQSF